MIRSKRTLLCYGLMEGKFIFLKEIKSKLIYVLRKCILGYISEQYAHNFTDPFYDIIHFSKGSIAITLK